MLVQMTEKFFACAVFALIATTSWAAEKPARIEIKSPAFQNGGDIPRKHTCDGGDVSPALAWSGAPSGTKAFALVADDPDAPGGTWVHWVVYDLPANTKDLAEGVPAAESAPGGAKQGVND